MRHAFSLVSFSDGSGIDPLLFYPPVLPLHVTPGYALPPFRVPVAGTLCPPLSDVTNFFLHDVPEPPSSQRDPSLITIALGFDPL